jgi:hypothetical protein
MVFLSSSIYIYIYIYIYNLIMSQQPNYTFFEDRYSTNIGEFDPLQCEVPTTKLNPSFSRSLSLFLYVCV